MMSPKIAAGNAGWRSQFHFRGHIIAVWLGSVWFGGIITRYKFTYEHDRDEAL